MNKSFKILSNKNIFPARVDIVALELNYLEAAQLLDLGVRYAGIVDMDGGWLIERNGKSEPDHIDFFHMSTGRLIIEYAHGQITAESGQTAIVPSWIDRRVSLPEPTRHLYFRIDNPLTYPHISDIDVHDNTSGNELEYYMQTLLTSNNLSDNQEYHTYLYGLIKILIQRELQGKNRETNGKIVELYKILHDNRQRQYSVELLAKKLKMSLPCLYRLCMESCGKSPLTVITEINMNRAKGLLRYTDMSIDCIAEKIGYASRFAFSKAFKKNMGITPVEYRSQKYN